MTAETLIYGLFIGAPLVETIVDPSFTAEALIAASNAKFQAGEMAESLRLAQRAIDLADGDPTKHSLILGSPLAFALALRASNRLYLGLPGFPDDFADAIAMTRSAEDTSTYVFCILLKYGFAVP